MCDNHTPFKIDWVFKSTSKTSIQYTIETLLDYLMMSRSAKGPRLSQQNQSTIKSHSGLKALYPVPPANHRDITNLTIVEMPVIDLIHLLLSNAWKINSDLNMWFIFDAVSPARQFNLET